MHDPPGLEVGDDLFDDIADLVDLCVELFLPGQKLTTCGLLKGRDHVIPHVPFVADPVTRVERREDSGLAKAMIIVAASGNRIGDPRETPANRADDLHVHSGGLVLPGIQLRVSPP